MDSEFFNRRLERHDNGLLALKAVCSSIEQVNKIITKGDDNLDIFINILIIFLLVVYNVLFLALLIFGLIQCKKHHFREDFIFFSF